MPVNQVQNTIDDAREQAKEYRQRFTGELAKIDDGIDAMADQLKQANVEVQSQYEGQVQNLRAQQRLVEVKLAEFQQSSEAAFEVAKDGLEIVWQDLVSTYERVSQEFRGSDR